MKVILEPTVSVLSQPMFCNAPELYPLPPHANAAENIIATAGKICYDSYGLDGNPVANHVSNLVNSGHESVLEHAHFGLFIAGISRGCSHEIVRHRMFNYAQRSTRYTAEDDAAIVLDPYYADIYRRLNDRLSPTSDKETDLMSSFLEGVESAFDEYKRTVGLLGSWSEDSRVQQGIPTNSRDYRKWVRGKARQLLPHALETRMVMTGNLRAWRHFLIMRSSRHAEAEIRRLADRVASVLQPLAPVVFQDLRVQIWDGFAEVTKA